MELLSAETISYSVCSALLNCCKIMNLMENFSLSLDDIIKSGKFLALTHMSELFEESDPTYIIIKLEMQKMLATCIQHDLWQIRKYYR